MTWRANAQWVPGQVSWFLLPTIRYGNHSTGEFLAITWLKFDACLRRTRKGRAR